MKIIISLIILLFPTWFEVYRDRNGDIHPNYDWKFRGLTCIIAGFLAPYGVHDYTGWESYVLTSIKYTTISIMLFTSIFPYWINFVHLKNNVTRFAGVTKSHRYDFKFLTYSEILKHVLTHLSDTAWPDKEQWYRSLRWIGRLIIYGLILCVSIYLLFV